MNNYYKGKAKYILASTGLALLITITLAMGNKMLARQQFYKILTSDTIPVKPAKQKRPAKIKISVNKDSLQKFNETKKDLPDTMVIPVKKNSAATTIKDSIQSGTTDTMYAKMSKDSLDAPVTYHADDSLVMDVPNNRIILYGKKSSTKYIDNDLDLINKQIKCYYQSDCEENVNIKQVK